jgi:hypothetical protein
MVMGLWDVDQSGNQDMYYFGPSYCIVYLFIYD